MEAARSGDVRKVKDLLRENVDPNDADAAGITPLIFAAMVGSVGVVGLLLDAGADKSRMDSLGYDAYKAAMLFGDFRGATQSPYDEVLRILDPAGSSRALACHAA